MSKIIHILETQFHTLHCHTPVPELLRRHWNKRKCDATLRFPMRQKTSRKSFTVCTRAPGNIRHPSSRPKMFEEVAQIKVGTVKSWSCSGDRIHSHSIPRPAERRYKKSGVGHLVELWFYQTTSTPSRRGRSHSRNVDKPSHLDAVAWPTKNCIESKYCLLCIP
jgi:hypothetical protein